MPCPATGSASVHGSAARELAQHHPAARRPTSSQPSISAHPVGSTDTLRAGPASCRRGTCAANRTAWRSRGPRWKERLVLPRRPALRCRLHPPPVRRGRAATRLSRARHHLSGGRFHGRRLHFGRGVAPDGRCLSWPSFFFGRHQPHTSSRIAKPADLGHGALHRWLLNGHTRKRAMRGAEQRAP